MNQQSSSRPTAPERITWMLPQLRADRWLREEMAALLDAPSLSNGGPHITALERDVSAWLDVPTVAVSSGATALEMALGAAGLRPETTQGRTAILPACTYIATLNAVQRAGLVPVFCDIDPVRWTLDPAALAECLRDHPDCAVVVPVNVYGVPPDLAAIGSLSHAAGAVVIYDNAQGMGTLQAGLVHPPHVDAVTWSMHATKLLLAGEGGLVSTPHRDWLLTAQQLRTHGLTPDPLDSYVGQNAKLSEFHALVARSGLARLAETLTMRRANLHRLQETIRAMAPYLRLQHVPDDVVHNGQNLTVLVCDAAGQPDTALALQWAAELATLGVETRRYFWPPLHHLRRLGGVPPSLPVTDVIMPALVSLPLHTEMPEATLQRLARAMEDAMRCCTDRA